MVDRRLVCWFILAVSSSAACGNPPARDGSEPSAEAEETAPPRQPPEYWARRLNDPSAPVRREALGNLGAYGREASSYGPIIITLLTDPDDKTGFTAAWALAHMGMGAHPLLIDRLESSNPDERERAAYGVGEMGAAGAVAAPQLRIMLNDPSSSVRNMASWALDQVTARRMVADPNMVLLRGLQGDRAERLEAIDRLAVTAPSSRVAVRELISLMGDSVPGIRARAIAALSNAGPSALPSLSMALSHRNKLVRKGALLAISRMHRVF
jgi:HEAT repeat protein